MSGHANWLAQRAAARRARGHVRHARPAPPASLDLSSNDYLGLSRDPEVLAAAGAALQRDGAGARASRVVTGTTAAHLELESALTRLTGRPRALTVASGYAANLAVLGALGGPGCRVLLDAHAHASLHDGARLSRSPLTVLPHGDVDAVTEALASRTEPRAIVVVESIYSVLGDAAELRALAESAREHDALLVVDEAHGIGVLGSGRGGVWAAGLADAAHVVTTLSCGKALGSQGGAILAADTIIDELVNTGRSVIFDTALAPAAAAAAAAAARRIDRDPGLAARLRSVAEAIAGAAGVVVQPGAVQSVPAPSPVAARLAADELAREGLLVGCFRPPSVPDGVSRLRLAARADLDPSRAASAAQAVREALERQDPA